jgi:hypothetical protein
MVIVISRKDLNNQAFDKAVIKDATLGKNCSLKGFAEAMYYYYKNEDKNLNERNG